MFIYSCVVVHTYICECDCTHFPGSVGEIRLASQKEKEAQKEWSTRHMVPLQDFVPTTNKWFRAEFSGRLHQEIIIPYASKSAFYLERIYYYYSNIKY